MRPFFLIPFPLSLCGDGTCKPCKSLGKHGIGTLGRQNPPPLCTRAFHSPCCILRSAFPGSVGTPGRSWDAMLAVPVFTYPFSLVTFPGRPRDGAGTAPANHANPSVNTALGRWDGKIHHLCAHALFIPCAAFYDLRSLVPLGRRDGTGTPWSPSQFSLIPFPLSLSWDGAGTPVGRHLQTMQIAR